MRPKKIVLALLIALLLMAAGLLLVNECYYWAGMGAAYKSCDCLGFERELYDHTAADGPRKTICIGLVRSSQCYQFMGGPAIDCKLQE
jgi:hypothetical protein